MKRPKPKSKSQGKASVVPKMPTKERWALQAAEEGATAGEFPEKHASGAKARIDSVTLLAGINPRPTARTSFSASCLAPAASSSNPPNESSSAENVSHSAQSQPVEIAKPIYGGAFLARVEGKAVFVPLTLPGERVRIRVTQSKSGYSTAELTEISTPSPLRIAPKCPYFGICGGCNYQHAGYETQLVFKQSILRETLERGGVEPPDEIAVLSSNPWAYRNRIRLAFDAAGSPGYRSRRSHGIIPISQCPIAAPLLLSAAQAVADALERVPANLRPTELQLFSNAEESALLVTFFAAESAPESACGRLDSLAQAIHERIAALESAELATGGRPGHPARTLAKWGAGFISYSAAGFDYRVDNGAFFQVNRWLADDLVECVAAGQSGKLAWDLFAGVGLFARKLTASFERVVAVESAPASKAALEHNLQGTNGQSIHAETLPFLRRQAKENPDLVVVDPPRSGLGPEIATLLAEIAATSLIYVSCDPATLARDLRALIASGYQLHSLTLADLFPQTFHLETVVHLRRS